MKRHLGSLLIGALAVGGVAYFGAQELTSQPDEVVLAQDERQAPEGKHPDRPKLRGAIRGEFVVPGDEEGTFQTVRTDRGIVERVEGSTVVIKEDDGTTVDVPTAEGTRISRDGQQAGAADLKAGDHVHALRINAGDGFVTRSVRAFSPERWEEMQKRREECRANREQCKAERMERRRGASEQPAA